MLVCCREIIYFRDIRNKGAICDNRQTINPKIVATACVNIFYVKLISILIGDGAIVDEVLKQNRFLKIFWK